MRSRLLLSILICFFVTIAGAYSQAANSCRQLIQMTSAADLIDYDSLELYREHEIKNLSPAEIREKNRRSLERVEAFFPEIKPGRAQMISLSDATALIPYVYNHEVTGFNSYQRYRRQNVEIGYCFGRATFIHLLLLKMGLQKESILKVWAVGSMNTGDISWGFHVATAAFVRGKGWMVIDTNEPRPFTLREWFNKHQQQNSDGRLRFYFTEPTRFTNNVRKYSPVQLGLRQNREQDWYRHYFRDLMSSIAGKSVSQLGIRQLTPIPQAANDNFKDDVLGDFFGR